MKRVSLFIAIVMLVSMVLVPIQPARADAYTVGGAYIPLGENGDLDWSVLQATNIPPQYDISALSPATKKFVNWLRAFPAVEFSQTFMHKSLYRADWVDGQNVGKVYGAYVWWDSFGVVHIRILMIDPPPVLNNCRTFQPDMFFVNRDNTVPDYDPCYLPWYRRWQTRPELDLWYQIQQSPLMRVLWTDSLREVELDNPEVQAALKRMDLEADGMPPFSSNYPVDMSNLDYMVQVYSEQMDYAVRDFPGSQVPSTVQVFDAQTYGEVEQASGPEQFIEVELSDLDILVLEEQPNVRLWILMIVLFMAAAGMFAVMVHNARRSRPVDFTDIEDGIDKMRRQRTK